MSDEELVFIQKILEAVKLKLDDVTMVNLDQDKRSFKDLKNSIGFTRMIVFGVTPNKLSLTIDDKKYCEFGLLNSKILFADFLEEILHDPTKKGCLWKGLKKLFEIK